MALIECGALLEVFDRRCRTAKDVAAENGQKQVVYTITIAEVEKAVSEGNVVKLKEVCTYVCIDAILCLLQLMIVPSIPCNIKN